MATATDDWRWGLRVTPIMGAVAVLLIIFLLVDPERGAADGSRLKPTSPISDLKALLRNKSFVFSTIAFTCVCYAAGALMWWGPNFAFYGAKSACGNKANCGQITLENISFRFISFQFFLSSPTLLTLVFLRSSCIMSPYPQVWNCHDTFWPGKFIKQIVQLDHVQSFFRIIQYEYVEPIYYSSWVFRRAPTSPK